MEHIKQQRINQIFVVYVVLIIIVLFVIGHFRSTASDLYNETVSSHVELLKVSRDIEMTSKYLTSQVRMFVITQDPTYMERYWREVDKHVIQEALEKIRLIQTDSRASFDALAKAKQESDDLIPVETKAMRLICESLGLPKESMESRVAALQLTEAELALSDQEKIHLAADLVFGDEYIKSADEIISASSQYRDGADAYFEDRTASALKRLEITSSLFWTAILLLMAGVAAALYTTYHRTIRPVLNFTDILKEVQGEESMPVLPEEGSFELRELAKAFNSSNRERLGLLNDLKLSEMKLKKHFQLMPLAAVEVDHNFVIDEWNPAAKKIFGYNKNEAVGKNIIDLLRMNVQPDELEDEIKGIQSERKNNNHLIFTNRTKDERLIICRWSISSIVNVKSDSIGWLLMASDITEEKREEERIVYLSWHDPLTGLYNRRYIVEKMQAEIDRRQRTGKTFSVIMLDIDNFKSVNDRHGHACGDYVLRKLSEVFLDTFRKTDFVSRWGGEEFLVILPVTSIEGAVMAAEKVRKRIQSEEFQYEGNLIHITISAGVAQCCHDDMDMMIKAADDALMEGKRKGKNRVIASALPVVQSMAKEV